MKTIPNVALGLALLLGGGCLAGTDEPSVAETENALIAGNKLAANKLAANSLETQNLMSTADGRELMSFIVGCALPTGQSVTALDQYGAAYTFDGWLNLAPAWATRAPTVSERRWVTACLLARTNVFGVPVSISMRHDTFIPLTSSAAERTAFPNAEGAFYGDLFAATPVIYACSNRSWTTYQAGTFRACALATGSTTDCTFKYTGSCSATPCMDKIAPFGSCSGDNTMYAEVVTIYLTPTQQQGATQ